MNKTTYLVSIILLLLSVSSCESTNTQKQAAKISKNAAEQTQPNIVFILVDDLGWADVGYNNPEIKTPNLDALAQQGVRLDRTYAYPICSPTRAALMSGQNPLYFGIDGPMENDAQLSAELTLLPEYLREGGYQTWMVGKWHLGMAKVSAMPHARGFDHFYGSLGGFIDYYTHVYFGGLDWQRNGKSLSEEGFTTDLLNKEAISLISNNKQDKPFFLYLSYTAPHTPLQYPPEVEHDYAELDSADRRVFAQLTSHVDAAIGEIIETLKQSNQLDNTLLVFMSDNGGNLEAGASNGDLKHGKGSAQEGGVRVPAIVSWPKGLKNQRVHSQPIFAQDWLPTLLDAANISYANDEFDGRSVLPDLLGSNNASHTSPVTVGTAKQKAVYRWPYKLLQDTKAEAETQATTLFNIEADPTESQDISEQFPELVAELNNELQRLPKTESKAAKGPKPETLFRKESGVFDYDIRKPETREPWAESATND